MIKGVVNPVDEAKMAIAGDGQYKVDQTERRVFAELEATKEQLDRDTAIEEKELAEEKARHDAMLENIGDSVIGVNDKGEIAGFFRDLNDGKFKGFKAELDGSQCQSLTVAAGDILDVPGSFANFAQGITNSGVIVGETRDANGQHGFIARPE